MKRIINIELGNKVLAPILILGVVLLTLSCVEEVEELKTPEAENECNEGFEGSFIPCKDTPNPGPDPGPDPDEPPPSGGGDLGFCLDEESGMFIECPSKEPVEGPSNPNPPPSTSPTGPPCGDLMALARYYAPYIYFHSEENYYPSSVDYYLPRVRMRNRDYPFYVKNNVTAQNIDNWKIFSSTGAVLQRADRGGNAFYVEHVEYNVRFGDVNNAPVYVYFKNGDWPEDLDIQYWIFFPYNGPTAVGGKGYHEGDWEHVTVRIRNGCEEIRRVYYGAHGSEGRWYYPNELSYVSNHPIVYVARDSHALYPNSGTIKRGGLKPRDRTNAGRQFAAAGRLVLVDDRTGTISNHLAPDWTRYRGRWGEATGDEGIADAAKPWGPRGPNWNDPRAPVNCACAQGYICINGECVEDPGTNCNDCKPGEICDNGWCRPI